VTNFLISPVTLTKTAHDIFSSHKLANCLSLFVSSFVDIQFLKEQSTDAAFSLSHENCKPQNKIEVAILQFDDVVLKHNMSAQLLAP